MAYSTETAMAVDALISQMVLTHRYIESGHDDGVKDTPERRRLYATLRTYAHVLRTLAVYHGLDYRGYGCLVSHYHKMAGGDDPDRFPRFCDA